MILDQIEWLCQHSLTATQIRRCEQAALHNQLLLDKMFATWHTDVKNSFLQAVEKCKRL
jgi:hypothetical protein